MIIKFFFIIIYFYFKKKKGESLIRILTKENEYYGIEDKVIIELQLCGKKGIDVYELDKNGKSLLHDAVHNSGIKRKIK